ncbi:MAG: M23 family metallopeptidase [Anaerolineaceae bacterium]|nr:M23 family metallopeptidase [Anaerolineaceae bacterium]
MKNLISSKKDESIPRKKRHFLHLILPTLILAVLAIFLFTQENQAASPKQVSLPPLDDATVNKLLNEQMPAALKERKLDTWKLFDVNFSEDRHEILLWMAEVDPTTNLTLPGEPHLILSNYDAVTSVWNMKFSIDDGFGASLHSSSFKDTEFAQQFPAADPKLPKALQVFGGYYLPWKAGDAKYLTWSIGHNSCAYGYCKYAFDFSDGKPNFPVLAAKGAYVFHFNDSCWDGDKNCTNSITLQDRSTTPWTYQIYLHLSRNSVPAAIRKIGTYVPRGVQIALSDNTGYSTGAHLHFMVTSSLTSNPCNWYCWGPSVDITFRDVKINWDAGTQGGRPRMYSEAQTWGGEYQPYNLFTSGNTPDVKKYFYILSPVFKSNDIEQAYP